MSTEAFGTRRVRESLKAIAKYLDDGAQIAAGVSPAQVLSLDLDSVTRSLGPRITNITPSVRRFERGEAETFNLFVTGTNLAAVNVFKLVRGGVEVVPTTIGTPTATSFTAAFTITDPVLGAYDAIAVNTTGQAFVFDDACTFRAHEHHAHRGQGSEVARERERDLRLDAIVPDSAQPGQPTEAILVLSRGSASDIDAVYIADRDGTRRDKWKVTILSEIKRPSPEVKKAMQRHQRGQWVALSISAPADEKPGAFHLVARSKASEVEDRLFVYVDQTAQPA
jgi:hypothetical protein